MNKGLSEEPLNPAPPGAPLINTLGGVKLVIGFIFKNKSALNKGISQLIKKFGPVDYQSQNLKFSHTQYYNAEFGSDLLKKIISFKKLIAPADLFKVKLFTGKLEKKLSRNSKRLVNIDPGYISLAKLVLATAKDYAHRIYLNKGIFAEVTLFFKKGSFKAWEFTYPDYRTKEYIEIFNQIRKIYARQKSQKLKK